jgi:hypothetical protein
METETYDMPIDVVSLNLTVCWIRPRTAGQLPYRWGDSTKASHDAHWNRSDLIYRWVRSSDCAVAYIGIPEKQALAKRIANYIQAGSNGAGQTNRKVYAEQQRLAQKGDCLFLEIADQISGYNLAALRERVWLKHFFVATIGHICSSPHPE